MVEIGVFDHMDDAGVTAREQFRDRLFLLGELEKAGFSRYQVAEHHGTPLGLAPSPNLFLAAAAQHTETLRLGALVNLLPMYNPLRLLEEIGMLDHLSGGRLDLGMGPGASMVEMQLFGIESRELARQMYTEGYKLIRQGLKSEEFSFAGRFYRAEDFPVVLRTVQEEVPLWYGSSAPDSMAWAASESVNVVSLGPAELVRKVRDRYAAEWAALARPASAMPLVGFGRHVVVAETDEEAGRIGRRAYERWRFHMNYLWQKRGQSFTLGAIYPEKGAELETLGHGIFGSPERVERLLREQLEETGASYLACHMMFGDLSREEMQRSIRLFGREVMPRLSRAPQPAAGAQATAGA